MTIHFIVGPAGSGKSTYRRNTFPDLPYCDIWDYQADCEPTQHNIIRSYVRHRRDCIIMAERGAEMVIEHTMLRAQRRAYYINKLRQHRLVAHYTTNPGGCPEYVMDVYEIPYLDEGFNELVAIKWEDEKCGNG
jgi:predicted kinase